jgi:hypothetical protein
MQRKLLITATVALIMSSCGYEISVQSTETTTTIPATTTTIYLGDDCNSDNDKKMDELGKVVGDAMQASDSVPTHKQWSAEVNAWEDYRSFVRSLDIPTLTVEQNAYVNAIKDYLVAYNRYMESRKTDLSVNNYRASLWDADDDFTIAWNEVCMNRAKVGA